MIPVFPVAPTLDAVLAEWAEVQPIPVDHPLSGHPSAHASARLAISGTSLFVAVEVTDDRFIPGSGAAGDHVEVWLGDPRMMGEEYTARLAWQRYAAERRDSLAARTRADEAAAALTAKSEASPPVLHVAFPAAGATRGITRATAGGWVAEVEVPLGQLPRVQTLTLSELAVRVDVCDADTTRPEAGMVSTSAHRQWSGLVNFDLASPVVLQSDAPWTGLGIKPDFFISENGVFEAGHRAIEWIGDAESVAGLPEVVPLPSVTRVAGPVPVRLVGPRVDLQDGDKWTTIAGSLDAVSGSARWSGPYLITTTELWDRGIPGPGMCGAATDTDWTLWARRARNLVPLLTDTSSTCMNERACTLDGDFVACIPDDPYGSTPARCWRVDAAHTRATEVPCPESDG